MSSALDTREPTALDEYDIDPVAAAVFPVVVTGGSWPSRLRRLGAYRSTWIVGIAALALSTRLIGLGSAYDIFIDETSYTNIARSVAQGRGATLYGLPFVLHPPAAFGLWGLAIIAFHLDGGTLNTLLALRTVDALLGAATCVVTFLLVDRMARRPVAVVAAVLIAVDPLAISFDSRVMLEAPAQLAMVSMFLFIAWADATKDDTRRRRLLFVAAGLAGGMAMATKETFGLVAMVTLVSLVVTGWVVTRQEALKVIAIAVLVYAASIAADASAFGFSVWWNAKFVGALRLVGAYQITGFNSAQTHVSLLSRIVANSHQFGVTYALLAAGTFCALGTLWRLEPWYGKRLWREPGRRASVMVSLWTLAAAGYLAYATLFGTIEEQMYYILLLPSAVSVCIWSVGWSADRTRRWRTVVTGLLGLALLIDLSVWASVHGGRDDEYRQLVGWEQTHVPVSAVVSTTDGTSQFLLTRGLIGQWSTIAQLQQHRVDYVVLATLLVDQGYGLAHPGFARTVEHRGRLVFQANGVSDGSLRVYNVQAITGAPA
jgi:4-amino-4-deoxy-L-arabinose transferase-like glycosyltransferase